LIDYACSAAYFWRLDPLDVMERSVADLVMLTAQAHRINAQMKQD